MYTVVDFDQKRMRKIRDSIPSITGILEKLRKTPNNTQLGS